MKSAVIYVRRDDDDDDDDLQLKIYVLNQNDNTIRCSETI